MIPKTRRPLRVHLNLTMREAGILHSVFSIVDGGNLEDIRTRKLSIRTMFNKLNAAEDKALGQ